MLNHITIMGRLTRDPELRTTQSGVNVASFTVACERDFAAGGGDRETDFIDCVAWRSTGEFVYKYFVKGQMIVVDGRLQSRKWQDRDGNNRTSWEINCDHTYFGEPKRDGGNQNSYSGGYSQPSGGYSPPPPTGGYNPPPARPPQQQYHQGTFTELDDSDGELPF
jgi:single-strand DNA-binding protein